MILRKRHLLIMLQVSLLHVSLMGQFKGLRFDHFGSEQGLAADYVTCIMQDSQGYLWIGTGAGLSRFDGYEFRNFFHDERDQNSLSYPVVSCMLEDPQGNLWVGTSDGLNYFDRQTEEFHSYFYDEKAPQSISNDVIKCLYYDSMDYLWIGTRAGGLNRLDPKTGTFKRFLHDAENTSSLSGNLVLSIHEDKSGNLWIGALNGLNHYNPETETFSHFLLPGQEDQEKHKRAILVYDIKEMPRERLLVCTNQGTYILDYGGSQPAFLPRKYFSALKTLRDRKGTIWLLNPGGLYATKDLETTPQALGRHDPGNPMTMSSNRIFDLYEDKEGNLWFATVSGLDRLRPEAFQFRHFAHSSTETNSISENYITSFSEDSKGQIFISTKERGVNRFDPKTETFQRYPFGKNVNGVGFRSGAVYNLFADKSETLWVGYEGSGFDRLEIETGQYRHFKFGDIIKDHVSYFYNDKDDVTWIGTQGGFNRLEIGSTADDLIFKFFPYSPDKPLAYGGTVSSMLEDSDGDFWVGTNTYGLRRFDRESERMDFFEDEANDSTSLNGNMVLSMFQDRKNRLWIGTEKGLNLFDRKLESFVSVAKEEGYFREGVFGIVEDDHGQLWVSAYPGLVRFNPDTNDFYVFSKEDGLTEDGVSYLMRSKLSGHIYVGDNGLTIFHPDSLQALTTAPPVVLTSFKYYLSNQKEEGFITDSGIGEKKSIQLSHQADILQFETAALSFRKTARNEYAYKLIGLHKDWIPLGTERSITITDLRPGAYTLRVKGSNGDGVWNENGVSLRIVITPPWYWSFWTKSLYLLSILSGIFLLYRYLLARQLERAEAHRLKELDIIKTKLYTNITHEFRTPLTVIEGLTDNIKAEAALKKERNIESNAKIVKRNSAQLLQLVNQLLELRKLESGTLAVNLRQDDVIAYLRYIIESFHSYAESKDIRLHFLSDVKGLQMDYDAEKLLTILSNLLSNAVKFTGEGGDVYVRVESDPSTWGGNDKEKSASILSLSIRDTGIGIQAEKLPHVFDRFYQVDDEATRKAEGTGIGLALTKELVQLFGGEIKVQSELGEGTVFQVTLPVTNKADLAEADSLDGVQEKVRAFVPAAAVHASTSAETTLATKQAQILMVEDNKDVMTYLRTCLEGSYQLEMAFDGQEGIDKAIEWVPDLIISDVMMPEKDGFELTATLKKDQRTSHIPIILLTAKADITSRIEGLEQGADAYLAKPFNQEELQVRLRKLLELRQNLQEKYSQGGFLPSLKPKKEKALSLDERFLKNAYEAVYEHLANEDFGSSQLQTALGVSRTQLHRKLKALTNQSTTQFIRTIRLQKAQELLQTTDLTVSEVAYQVGFKSPVYFTQAFTDAFGEPPSQFRKH